MTRVTVASSPRYPAAPKRPPPTAAFLASTRSSALARAISARTRPDRSFEACATSCPRVRSPAMSSAMSSLLPPVPAAGPWFPFPDGAEPTACEACEPIVGAPPAAAGQEEAAGAIAAGGGPDRARAGWPDGSGSSGLAGGVAQRRGGHGPSRGPDPGTVRPRRRRRGGGLDRTLAEQPARQQVD